MWCIRVSKSDGAAEVVKMRPSLVLRSEVLVVKRETDERKALVPEEDSTI
jgi:hypothetical protein